MKDYMRELKIDYLLIFSLLVLVCIGIVTIYSAGTGSSEGSGLENQYLRQIYWALGGIAIFILILFINFHKLSEYATLIYGAGILLLFLTLLIGKRVRGATSWIMLFGGIGFQPSEFVKIAVIIALARFLARIGDDIRYLKNVIIALAIGLMPAGLILLQPDFGTALVYIPICLVMLFFAGIRYMHLLSLLIILAIAVSLPLLTTFGRLTKLGSLSFLEVLDDTKIVFMIALIFGFLSFVMFVLHRITKRPMLFKAMSIFLIFFFGLILAAPLGRFLKPYQKARLIVFLKPSIDPFGAGYNIIQSKIAVGAGGVSGRGLMGGTQSQLGFLPERSTDFIFSIFAEEWGFFGTLVLLGFYGLFMYRGVVTMYKVRERFSSLLVSGLVGMFLFHIIINIGMTIGVMPITGIPLPFLSYGGSFLITCMAGAAIIMNVEMRKYAR